MQSFPKKYIRAIGAAVVFSFLVFFVHETQAATPAAGASCTDNKAGAKVCYGGGCFTCTSGVWVADPIKVGATTSTCDSSTAGMIRWTGTAFQGCDGSAWNGLATSACDNTSANLDLGDQTDLAVNTLTTSSIVLVTGLDSGCTVSVGVSGTGGNPYYRVCSDSACSTVVQDWTQTNYTLDMQGKYLQLKATSASTVATGYTITIAVGPTSSTWAISTGMTDCAPEGTVCSDGTVYAGLSGASTPMYTTRCDAGQTWDSGSSACTGTRSGLPWNNGNTTGYVATGVTGTTDGKTYTATLIVTDSDSETEGTQLHQAAQYCADLVEDGHSDWYLPAQTELNTLYNNASAIGGFDSATSDDAFYWSSTESSAYDSYAYCLRLSDGATWCGRKGSNLHLRCTRR